jgi:hypothetical protein
MQINKVDPSILDALSEFDLTSPSPEEIGGEVVGLFLGEHVMFGEVEREGKHCFIKRINVAYANYTHCE